MEIISKELKALLYEEGADLVGFADLSETGSALPFGVSIAIGLSIEALDSLREGDKTRYKAEVFPLEDIERIVDVGANYLNRKGYKTVQLTEAFMHSEAFDMDIQLKTIATRGGLGWVGRCSLLVTEKFGLAQRLSALITDAPLLADRPVTQSFCGDCNLCVRNCPGKAMSGRLWNPQKPHCDLYFDLKSCLRGADICGERIPRQKGLKLCGQCLGFCPHTEDYINRVKRRGA
ncbi:MAG: epoxyqueuosine reductase [Clostridiales Family XIII bacterium]|jgi:epoxyqueuosine reductase QueG|nr:epoxyqueuosine reductase [Clostridiales Family XIII bacterium]